MSKRAPSFQEAIMRLERFWAQQGCVIWQPYNVQVGAGTMNPATFFRVLGPEPWRVAYVEPSVRPADGRYAENPNRWQQYYQYQVILKPDPGDPQELYLRSLEAIGVDLAQHDVRFVEDNWEQPALGAWGLGWEVWCDGQEISQYTYMQQAGGFALDPVSVELTYGLERIMLFLQGAETFLDIAWEGDITYGDLLYRQEVEHCTYNFELADVERLQNLYRLCEAEAQAGLERGLVIPAYDYILKCSHVFNVLDARGAIGVTERAGYFARMRELARRVTAAFLKEREEAGFPLQRKREWVVRPKQRPLMPVPGAGSAPQDFVLEIGTEELPHQDLQWALAQLEERVPRFLSQARLSFERVRVLGTPRRLAVLVSGLAARQADEVRVVKGPPAQAAFDAEGRPTRAAEGFARRHGLEAADLEVAEMDGGRYAIARTAQEGRAAGEVLSELLPELIGSLRFGLSMRWNESSAYFSRPIRWLVALLGQESVPFEYAGLYSDRWSRGLRTGAEAQSLPIESAGQYEEVMGRAGIVLCPEGRRRLIAEHSAALAASVGGQVRPDAELLAEVADLVEAPVCLLGQFSEEYLALPSEVLITVMKKHQRYFALECDGKLMPHFVAVRNGGKRGEELVRQGNEAVLQARFADAAYFYRRDLSQTLEGFLPRVGTLAFQERLGSMLDKTKRLESLVGTIGALVGVPESGMPHLRRAARLSKADLASNMVIEFTSLQGVMGSLYAGHQGEDERVVRAIFEHYLPRYAGDAVAKGRLGLALSIADRLDSILGLLAVGLEPTGSADPYALRRAASGLVQSLLEWEERIDLQQALAAAARELPVEADAAVQKRALDFIAQRLRVQLLDRGLRYDVVEAVLAERKHDPYWAAVTALELQEWVTRPDWMDILNAYARCKRILRDVQEGYEVRPERFVEEASVALYHAYLEVAERIDRESRLGDLMVGLQELVAPINRFFDEVLVMAEDAVLRENRLGLVQRVAALTEGIVDLSRLEGF